MVSRAASLLSLLWAVAACAAIDAEPKPRGLAAYEGDPRLGEAVDSICFASNIDGFSLNQSRTVVLHEGRDRYMVEVFGTCPELEFAQTIALITPSACLTRGDAVLVAETFGPPGPHTRRCAIREIRKWNAKMPVAPGGLEGDEGAIAR